MAVVSIKFLVFCLISLSMYFIIPKKYKWIVLLLSSYIFYYLSSNILIIAVLLTSLSIYISGLLLEKKKNKLVLLGTIIFNLVLLFLFKYFNILDNISFIKTNLKDISLVPFGIAYYTLQAISYIIDVYRGKVKPEHNYFKLSLFLVYFPIISEGPFCKYDKLSTQLYEGHSIDYDNLKHGLTIILFGLFKKMVIADRAVIYVNSVFDLPNHGITLFMGAVMYTIYLYMVFSGIIDIMRGISLMMGIKLEENFKRPFFSTSVQEFWRRWHITLGVWLRDYIFYPISLSKLNMRFNKIVRSKFKNNFGKTIIAAFPLLFVWLANGVWHGVGSKFIIYGMYYYVVMILGLFLRPVFDKLIKLFKINVKSFGYKLFQIIRTNFIVLIGMLIYYQDNIFCAYWDIRYMLTLKNNGIFNNGLVLIDFIIILLFIIILIVKGIMEEKGIDVYEKINKSNIILQDLLLILTILIIIVFGIYGPEYNVANYLY